MGLVDSVPELTQTARGHPWTLSSSVFALGITCVAEGIDLLIGFFLCWKIVGTDHHKEVCYLVGNDDTETWVFPHSQPCVLCCLGLSKSLVWPKPTSKTPSSQGWP